MWWYTIIQTVALAIDNNANKSEVRNFFVQHEGKKTLTITTGPSIYGVNYDWFFEQMSDQIASKLLDTYLEIQIKIGGVESLLKKDLDLEKPDFKVGLWLIY